jgi:hypothetical protein
MNDRYKQEAIEAASDVVVWCCDEGVLSKGRDADISIHANLVDAIEIYAKNSNALPVYAVDRVLVIGSDAMMHAVTQARHGKLKHLFKEGHVAIGSINSPMQCMMKEICGKCIQRHVDPVTQRESYVYSCANQDQPLDFVDFTCLNNRLKQNTLLEKIFYYHSHV